MTYGDNITYNYLNEYAITGVERPAVLKEELNALDQLLMFC